MKKKQRVGDALPCPCGSGQSLVSCCGPYHAGVPAPDAASLMRARYSAYAIGNEAYLLATWHASTRPAALDLSADTGLKWIGLTVKAFKTEADQAEVAFVARYKQGGRAGKMAENSRFVREGGCWFYVDGDVQDA